MAITKFQPILLRVRQEGPTVTCQRTDGVKLGLLRCWEFHSEADARRAIHEIEDALSAWIAAVAGSASCQK